MFSVYKIKFKSSKKVYIGYTSKTIAKRLSNHIKNALNGHDIKLSKAIRKYGIDNIQIEKIYETYDKKEATDKERYFIEHYDSYKNGYNETLGGEGTIGFKHTKEFKEKKSIFFSKNNPSFGGISEKQKQKISNTKSLNWIITTPDMEKIKITNLYNFCKKNNLHVSAMVRVASGERKHHKNFVCEKVI